MSSSPRSPVAQQQERARRLEAETDDENFAIDNAFLKACRRCGIEPTELRSKPLGDFESAGVPHDVAVRRFNNHQAARIRKLHMIVQERRRVLHEDDAAGTKAIRVPHPPTAQSAPRAAPSPGGSGSGSGEEAAVGESSRGTSGGRQRDAMLLRAQRMREHWDRMNKRRAHHREVREEQQRAQEERAAQLADKLRREREEQEALRLLVHKANATQLMHRWERDEALAESRQMNIDVEYELRREQLEDHLRRLDAARQQRRERLEQRAFTRGRSENTQARVERAHAVRSAHDAKIAEAAQAALDKVDERRRDHTVRRLLAQVDVVNRAIAEREHVEEVIRRAEAADARRRRKIEAKRRARGTSAERRAAEAERERRAKLEALATKRDASLEGAHGRREQQQRAAAEARARKKEEAAAQERERRERRALEEMLRREDCAARDEARRAVLVRVAKSAQVLQEERAERQRARQERAESRRRQWREQLTAILRGSGSDDGSSAED